MAASVPAETLPTLDLRRFDAPGAERSRFLEELKAAARGVGFFYLSGHGIGDRLIRRRASLSRRFFALPEQDKLAIEMVNSPHFRGYNRAGFEHTRGKPDWREQIDIGAERAGAAVRRPAAPPGRGCRGRTNGRCAAGAASPTLLALSGARSRRSRSACCRRFRAALEQPEDIFEPIYTPAPNQLLKIIRYPGRAAERERPRRRRAQGFAALSPSCCRTKSAGLQVEGERRLDRCAAASRGTFVVNIGEISRDRPPTAICAPMSIGWSRRRPGADRLSVAFFLGARLDATVPVLDLCRRISRPMRAA